MEKFQIILKDKKILILIIILIFITLVLIKIFDANEENYIDILNQMEVEANIKNEQTGNMNEENETKDNISEEIPSGEKIVIHIIGEVKKTGIVYLEKGSRIVDAIEAAGGTTKNANLNQVNLAYILEDGQKIYIPSKKEKEKQIEYIISNSGKNVLIEENTNSKQIEGKGENKKVNINTANQTELETLPGIGPSLAQRIIEYRKENGKFKEIEDVQQVKGIGDNKYSNIKDKICI